MELFDEYVTSEMATQVLAILSTATLGLLTLVKLARWVFRDKTTNEQRQLFDALIRRLENGSLEWKETDKQFLSLHDEAGLLVQAHSNIGALIYLGEVDVEPMLTRRQRNQVHKVAQARRERLREETRYNTITAAIREARRPVV